MPFTFSHPAAVLPLRQYCPKYLNLPALMAGSLAPDLGYYMHNWHWSVCGHSFLGSLKFDLPAGLLLTALFYISVRPVARLLPYPHREALSSICPVLKLPSLHNLVIAAFSVVMGAWTHIIWDGFTHANGWCVREFSSFTPALFTLGTYKVTVWHILQHGSTILGLLLLFNAYNFYVHGKRFLKHQQILGVKSRLLIWSLILIPPAVASVSKNIGLLSSGFSIPRFDEFCFNVIVSYICFFLPLLFVAGVFVSILEYLKRPGREMPASLPEPVAEPTLVPVFISTLREAELSSQLPVGKELPVPLPAVGFAKSGKSLD